MNDIHSIFVYGTLKRGGLRSSIWPVEPLQIREATIQAKLYDLGPYPAIGPGNDWILGEVWTIPREELSHTLELLDETEGYMGPGQANQYIRVTTNAVFEDSSQLTVQTYRYANLEELSKCRCITPWKNFGGRLSAAWPDEKSRVPKSFAEELLSDPDSK